MHGHWKNLTPSTEQLGIINKTTATLTLRQHAASAKHSAATNRLPYQTQHGGNSEAPSPSPHPGSEILL